MKRHYVDRYRVRGNGEETVRWIHGAPDDQSSPTLDWMAIWPGCERRLRSWNVPSNWTASDWLEEMRAEGAMAALLAIQDYRSELNVPLGAYVRMRMMGRILTRYRKEWSYARHEFRENSSYRRCPDSRPGGKEPRPEDVAQAFRHLSKSDQQILRDLYWREKSEAAIARALGISQQSISKRKLKLLAALKTYLKTYRSP